MTSIASIKMLLEAILLTSEYPVSVDKLRERLPLNADIQALVRELSSDYQGRSIAIEEVLPGQYATRTRPEVSQMARSFSPPVAKLSKAAVETLYIVALFQPITRPEIDRIRGVQASRGVLDALMAQDFIRPAARRDTPGNPLTFVTTEKFLIAFNLRSVEDLPELKTLKDQSLLNRDVGLPIQSSDEATLSYASFEQ